MPKAPEAAVPDEEWEHYELWGRVQQTLAALAVHFRSETNITGILVTDLHALNTLLGASIEEQTVASLNAMRSIWDPDGTYALYRFVRQSQCFPDVLLRKAESVGDASATILGIELKGWYVLAKEGVPTFRYQATAAACAVPDLLVIVPWALSQVISGRPIALTPHIMSARHAAELRNYYWQHERDVDDDVDTKIESPKGIAPYMPSGSHTDDHAAGDKGGNFGRIARTGILKPFITEVQEQLLCGVRVKEWVKFIQGIGDSDVEGDKGKKPLRRPK